MLIMNKVKAKITAWNLLKKITLLYQVLFPKLNKAIVKVNVNYLICEEN